MVLYIHFMRRELTIGAGILLAGLALCDRPQSKVETVPSVAPAISNQSIHTKRRSAQVIEDVQENHGVVTLLPPDPREEAFWTEASKLEDILRSSSMDFKLRPHQKNPDWASLVWAVNKEKFYVISLTEEEVADPAYRYSLYIYEFQRTETGEWPATRKDIIDSNQLSIVQNRVEDFVGEDSKLSRAYTDEEMKYFKEAASDY